MKQLFPQIYRTITAHKKVYSNTILLVLIFFFFLLAGVSFYLTTNYIHLTQARQKELQSLISWEKLIKKFPTYPEVYYQAAIHAVNLKDDQKAEDYIQKALLLNPSFTKAVQLKKQMENL